MAYRVEVGELRGGIEQLVECTEELMGCVGEGMWRLAEGCGRRREAIIVFVVRSGFTDIGLVALSCDQGMRPCFYSPFKSYQEGILTFSHTMYRFSTHFISHSYGENPDIQQDKA